MELGSVDEVACKFGNFLKHIQSIAGVIGNVNGAFAMFGDTGFTGNNVPGDNGPPDGFAKLDLRFVLAEFTATDQNGPALDLQSGAALLVVIPLNEGAVGKTNGALARNSGDLIAWAPKGAIHETDAARVCGFNADHGWVRAVA